MGFFSFIHRLILGLFGMANNNVFLSFSNEETGKNFSDHLHTSLTSAGFGTIRNIYDGIERGDQNKLKLAKRAIQKSKISVVVFSKDYASSTQCLDELVMIMDARRSGGHTVLPVFYWVEPSEVRKQGGIYGKAFLEHEKQFKDNMGRVQEWRTTLKDAANLSGMVLGHRGENTRRSFTDHLYAALIKGGIRTFRDDEGIRRAEDIESEIKKAIQESELSVIVFSKDYTSSRWCLDELIMIMESRTVGHMVVPVFYDVDPFQVRRQAGRFGERFAGHEIERVEGWRRAVEEVVSLPDKMVLDGRHEAPFIQDIVAQEPSSKKLPRVSMPLSDKSRVKKNISNQSYWSSVV